MLRSLSALLAGGVLLVLGVLFGLVLLIVVAALGLGVWAWLWWKTRELRGAMRDAANNAPRDAAAGGQVFEGEAVVVAEEAVRIETALPRPPRSGD